MDPVDSSSDEEFNENEETQVQPGIEDFSNFNSNYLKLKEDYKT